MDGFNKISVSEWVQKPIKNGYDQISENIFFLKLTLSTFNAVIFFLFLSKESLEKMNPNQQIQLQTQKEIYQMAPDSHQIDLHLPNSKYGILQGILQ